MRFHRRNWLFLILTVCLAAAMTMPSVSADRKKKNRKKGNNAAAAAAARKAAIRRNAMQQKAAASAQIAMAQQALPRLKKYAAGLQPQIHLMTASVQGVKERLSSLKDEQRNFRRQLNELRESSGGTQDTSSPVVKSITARSIEIRRQERLTDDELAKAARKLLTAKSNLRKTNESIVATQATLARAQALKKQAEAILRSTSNNNNNNRNNNRNKKKRN